MAETIRGVVAGAVRKRKRREILGAILAGVLIVAPCFGLGYWFGGLGPRARLAELETVIYLGTREFHVAGTELKQYVVSYLRGDKVVEVPTYSPEARDRVIERLGR